MNYYTALTNYFSSLSSLEQKKIGESVGYINIAESKINECVKMKFYKEYQDSLNFTVDVIDAKYVYK
jgi:hypothetical protein